MAVSVLGLEVGESERWPFKNGVSVGYSLMGLMDVSPAGFQSYVFGGLSPRCMA